MRRCLREREGIFFMGYVQGEGRAQATLFPVTLEELIPNDHVCRVMDAFVERMDMAELGFGRAGAGGTGGPGFCPRGLPHVCLYGGLQPNPWRARVGGECPGHVQLNGAPGR